MTTRKTTKVEAAKTPKVKPKEDNTGLSLEKLEERVSKMEKKSKKPKMNLATILAVVSLLIASIGVVYTIIQVKLAKRITIEERRIQALVEIDDFFFMLDSDDLKKSMAGAEGLIPYLDTNDYHEKIFEKLEARTKNMRRPNVDYWTKSKKEYLEYENELIKPYLFIIDKLAVHEKNELCKNLLRNREIFFSKFPVLDFLNPNPTDDIWVYLAKDPEIAFRKALYRYIQLRAHDKISRRLLEQLRIDTINIKLRQ